LEDGLEAVRGAIIPCLIVAMLAALDFLRNRFGICLDHELQTASELKRRATVVFLIAMLVKIRLNLLVTHMVIWLVELFS
jgi:hypothetical protein